MIDNGHTIVCTAPGAFGGTYTCEPASNGGVAPKDTPAGSVSGSTSDGPAGAGAGTSMGGNVPAGGTTDGNGSPSGGTTDGNGTPSGGTTDGTPNAGPPCPPGTTPVPAGSGSGTSGSGSGGIGGSSVDGPGAGSTGGPGGTTNDGSGGKGGSSGSSGGASGSGSSGSSGATSSGGTKDGSWQCTSDDGQVVCTSSPTCESGYHATSCGTCVADGCTGCTCENPDGGSSGTGGCTLTQGYWKNHPTWPVSSLTLGGTTYTEAQLMTILNTPPGGDGSLILAHQLIATLLNAASGAGQGPIASVVQQAQAWLAANSGGKSLPYAVSTSTSAGAQAVSLANQLDAYNNGMSGVPHCH